MTIKQNNDNYKNSLKAASLFGGVQVYNIIISIIRTKFVAILLGPFGMGIQGLLISTTSLISSFTSFGLSISSVRNISEAKGNEDHGKISLVTSVLKNLVWVTGVLGALVCLFFAPLWSDLTFGNSDYTYSFIYLSVSILFLQLTSGYNAILQGLQKYKFLAKTNLFGCTLGLIITIPLYYVWNIDAIVPVLLISNIINFLFTFYFVRKLNLQSKKTTFIEIKKEGRGMLKMGFFISLQEILLLLSAYLIRIYISNYGTLKDVGLYTAGFTMVNVYVGMVFKAMGKDYYPRLSSAAKDQKLFNKMVSDQAEISLLVLSPLILIFIVFIKPAITLLYTSKFLAIEGMVNWAVFAILFKALSWSISFSFLAKGDTKSFFYNELLVISYGLGLNVFGYHSLGLTGLGISFLVIYLLYSIQVLIVGTRKYKLKIRKAVFVIFLIQLGLSISCFVIKQIGLNLVISYMIGAVLIGLSVLYSISELGKRVALKALLEKLLPKK